MIDVKTNRINHLLINTLILFSLFFIADTGSAQNLSSIPDKFMYEFTTRQIEAGEVSDSFYLHQLSCNRNDCELISLTMNQCVLGKFYPKIEKFKTSDDELEVVRKTGGSLLVTARGARDIIYTISANRTKVLSVNGHISSTNVKIILNTPNSKGEKIDCRVQSYY